MGTCGIYMIRNAVNGRCYVGSSFNIERRFNAHRSLLKHGKHHSPSLQRAWKKHGNEAFEFKILEIVENVDGLLIAEQRHIELLNAADAQLGYNVSPVAGTRRGVPQPDSVREKLRAERKGVPKSAETRAKMSAAAKARPPKSEEHKRKLSEATKRQFADPEAREKAAEYGRMATPWLKGKSLSDDVKRELSRQAKERASTNKGKSDLQRMTELARVANTKKGDQR